MSLTSWHERGRPALFEALAAVCDKLEDELDAEFKEKTQICKHNLKPGELEALRTRATEADRLEQDNWRLREALSKLEKEKAARGSSVGTTTVDSNTSGAATIITLVPATPTYDQTEMSKELLRLKSSLRFLQKNFNTAKESLVKRKTERDQWVEYSKQLEKKIYSLRARGRNKNVVQVTEDVEEDLYGALNFPSTSFSSDAGIGGATRDAEVQPTSSNEPPAFEEEERICETQPLAAHTGITQNGTDGSPTQDLPSLQDVTTRQTRIKNEPISDDTPMIVDVRPVRKRRLDDIPDDGATSRPVARIKEEHRSDAAESAELASFSPADSLDLDTVGATVQTPRRCGHEEDLACSMRVEVFSSQPSVISDSPCQVTLEDRACLIIGTITSKRNQGIRPPPRPPLENRIPLAPLPNANQRSPQDSRGGIILTSTGADISFTAHQSTINAPPPPPPPPPPQQQQHTKRPTVSSVTIGAPQPRSNQNLSRIPSLTDLDVPQPRELPFGNTTCRRDFNRSFHEEPSSTALRRERERERDRNLTAHIRSPNVSFTGAPRDVAKKQAPKTDTLRTRKATELRPEDFKINPKFNSGMNYAYNEVVRGRVERAALPGCTDSSCCGQDFRVLARAERGNQTRTAEQRQEDKLYLERYLGDDCFRLFGMTREEMDDLWIEAKAKELADRWGKHRHRFARAKSPPGFWNPDFPSTQEVEKERGVAEERRRAEVEERFKEAMRPGGRWLFRDE